MKSFKATVLSDLEHVFQNDGEFSEKMNIIYGKMRFIARGVLDKSETVSQGFSSLQYGTKHLAEADLGLSEIDARLFVNVCDFKGTPKSKTEIVINAERFKISKVSEEMGEYVLYLSRFDD